MLVSDLITALVDAITNAKRFGHRLLCGPAVAETRRQRGLFQADDRRPLSDALRDSTVGDEHVRPRVSLLRDLDRPDAIFWRVRTLVVLALNRMKSAWPGTHVCEESLERCFPSLAYRDASAAVVLIALLFLIAAPLVQVCPNPVLPRLAHPVREVSSHENLDLEASARFRMTVSQMQQADDGCFPAGTPTREPSTLLPRKQLGFDRQLSIRVPNHIYCLHEHDYTVLTLNGAM